MKLQMHTVGRANEWLSRQQNSTRRHGHIPEKKKEIGCSKRRVGREKDNEKKTQEGKKKSPEDVCSPAEKFPTCF